MDARTMNTMNSTLSEAAPSRCYWLPPSSQQPSSAKTSTAAAPAGTPPTALCFGTGRFLRSVLVPLLQRRRRCNDDATVGPALIQTRGTSFVEHMRQQEQQQQQQQRKQQDRSSFEVDTVFPNGDTRTDRFQCSGAFSMRDRASVYEVLVPLFALPNSDSDNDDSDDNDDNNDDNNDNIILGVGVTEAGLASANTQAMRDLYDLLCALLAHSQKDSSKQKRRKICLINTDNVPRNGDVLKQHMMALAAQSDDNGASNSNSKSNSKQQLIANRVAFLHTMVDRITSHRPDNPMVPRAEGPVPSKALVVLDPDRDLPLWFAAQAQQNSSISKPPLGLVLRQTAAELDADLALKLRVANGTHTALAHAAALCGLGATDQLAVGQPANSGNGNGEQQQQQQQQQLWLDYLDALVRDQILPAATATVASRQEAAAVWEDWRSRLTHPHFGLSTFFITQNGAAKGGLRLGPTVVDLMKNSSTDGTTAATDDSMLSGISVTMAFAWAALLRWLTPAAAVVEWCDHSDNDNNNNNNNKGGGLTYRGWLQGALRSAVNACSSDDDDDDDTVVYADGLRYNLKQGWYEFRCACEVSLDNDPTSSSPKPVSEWLAAVGPLRQPAAYLPAIRAYLRAGNGGNLALLPQRQLDVLARSIATLYARMLAGDDLLALLREMKDSQGSFSADSGQTLVDAAGSMNDGRPLHYRPSPIPNSSALMHVAVTQDTAAEVVRSEVAAARIIDLHTHLLPPSHGSLCLWGIDELLSYHYLVAEYFITAPVSMTPEMFYNKTKQEQADLVWKHLFVDRSPISEACRGVVTTLVALGLSKEVQARDLLSIRTFYSQFRKDGLDGAERFSRLVHQLSGVRYNIMTNIPFDPNEVQHWRPKAKALPDQYRSALRVDPFLSGDQTMVENALKASGYDTTLEGARQFLRDWIKTMQPEYMMASTPHNFALDESGRFLPQTTRGINLEAMNEPGAFVQAIQEGATFCAGDGDDVPSIIHEHSDLLSDVLMNICDELDIPLALKIGADRGVNPRLQQAGDGVVAFADAGMLGRLCARFPKVRFLATFLSRNNQHEACVLASKFGNLHIYGCWWYCFTPSIMKEITKMRIEMLGTAFTAQHSDARVLDQLIYKWAHSRAVIADVVTEEVAKLCSSGWSPTRSEIRRDVARIFGRSYEEFMAKSWHEQK